MSQWPMMQRGCAGSETMATNKGQPPLTPDLFDQAGGLQEPEREELAPGAVLLRGQVAARGPALMNAVERVVQQVPLRQMMTPGGKPMSVAMASCGDLGWVTDRRGYRYEARDPESAAPWPPMPPEFADLARQAAAAAGYPGFRPDACLINRYATGARMGLHQDRDERDMGQPIVSVSLGMPAVFLFGGFKRAERPLRIRLAHGDVVVWGGPSRLRFHGIAPLKAGHHPLTGEYRFNLTFRKAG